MERNFTSQTDFGVCVEKQIYFPSSSFSFAHFLNHGEREKEVGKGSSSSIRIPLLLTALKWERRKRTTTVKSCCREEREREERSFLLPPLSLSSFFFFTVWEEGRWQKRENDQAQKKEKKSISALLFWCSCVCVYSSNVRWWCKKGKKRKHQEQQQHQKKRKRDPNWLEKRIIVSSFFRKSLTITQQSLMDSFIASSFLSSTAFINAEHVGRRRGKR